MIDPRYLQANPSVPTSPANFSPIVKPQPSQVPGARAISPNPSVPTSPANFGMQKPPVAAAAPAVPAAAPNKVAAVAAQAARKDPVNQAYEDSIMGDMVRRAGQVAMLPVETVANVGKTVAAGVPALMAPAADAIANAGASVLGGTREDPNRFTNAAGDLVSDTASTITQPAKELWKDVQAGGRELFGLQEAKPATGMKPPAAPAAAAPAAAPAAAEPVRPQDAPATEAQINKGINMELARRRRQEGDRLAAENGYDVTYDDDGTRRLTPLSNATSGKGMTSGIKDSGVGGNVYQKQLENMQNMRLRSDMMDQVDYLQRRVQAGDRGIGDLPSYRADQAALAKLMGQAGPGGEMEQTNAAVAGRLQQADITGRYGMMGEQLKGQNQMAIEQVQSGDRRYNTDSIAASNAAKLAQEGILAQPKFGMDMAKLQYLQENGITPEGFAAVEGKYQQPEYSFTDDGNGNVVAGNKQTGEQFVGGTNAAARGAQSAPPEHVAHLRQFANNPQVIADFEAKYGKGSAQLLLQQAKG